MCKRFGISSFQGTCICHCYHICIYCAYVKFSQLYFIWHWFHLNLTWIVCCKAELYQSIERLLTLGMCVSFSEAINGTHFVLSMLVDDLFIRLFNVRIFRLWKIIACTLCTHVKWKESLSEFPFARKIYSGKHCVDAVKTESECICEWIKPGMLQHITFTNIKTRKISIFKMTM